MTEEARFLSIRDPNLGPADLNHAQNAVFRHFLKFCLSVFFEIAYNDSLQQCRSKTHEKNFWGSNLGKNQAQN